MKEILTNNTPEKWEEIKTHPFYKKELETLVEEGEEYLSSPIPALPLSAFRRFMQDGNRSEFERPYFERRRRIARLAILCRLYGEKYKDALEDMIWAVLEESSWTLPAHLHELYTEEYDRRTFLDLFSTETGALLAETDHILADRLSSFVRERIKREVRERIIAPFFTRYHWEWMDGPDNWDAVCTSQVALCIMYLGTETEFRRAEPTFARAIDIFLSTYGEDGCCLEGLNYWNYGFGFLLNYADAIRNYSEGRTLFPRMELSLPHHKREDAHDHERGIIDYFKREDVKRAALFAQNVRLTGDSAVSFSDANAQYACTRSHLYLLMREYPGLVSYPDKELLVQSASAGSHGILRHFLWSDPEAEYGAPMKNETIFYEEGGWFIRKSERYSIAAKGGHNDEAHNHNDVGSFLIATREGHTFCDLGSGEYTRQYFDEKTRYDYLVCSSRGHSVPIVNGVLQKKGKEPSTVITDRKDAFSVSFAACYEESSLKELTRRFACDENGFTMTDTYVFDAMPKSVTERFVTCCEPVLGDGEVMVGDVVLRYDSALFAVSVTRETYSAQNCKMTVAYLLDLIPLQLDTLMTFGIRFDILEK